MSALPVRHGISDEQIDVFARVIVGVVSEHGKLSPDMRTHGIRTLAPCLGEGVQMAVVDFGSKVLQFLALNRQELFESCTFRLIDHAEPVRLSPAHITPRC